MPGPALHFDRSSVLVGDPPHEAEPETGSVNLRGSRSVGTVEPFEYVWHDVGRHPDASVAHDEFRGSSGSRDRHDDRAAGRSEFDRVVNEVQQQPLHPLTISGDVYLARSFAYEVDVLGFSDGLERLDDRRAEGRRDRPPHA